jgi:hypothetical protein
MHIHQLRGTAQLSKSLGKQTTTCSITDSALPMSFSTQLPAPRRKRWDLNAVFPFVLFCSRQRISDTAHFSVAWKNNQSAPSSDSCQSVLAQQGLLCPCYVLMAVTSFIRCLNLHTSLRVRSRYPGMLRCVALVRTDFSEKLIDSFIKVTKSTS